MLAKLKGPHSGCPLSVQEPVNQRGPHWSHRPIRHGSLFRCSSRRSHTRHANRTTLTRCTASDRLSFYSVLGVKEDATLAEIKSAFRRLAKRWHPDHNTGASAKSKYQVSQLACPCAKLSSASQLSPPTFALLHLLC